MKKSLRNLAKVAAGLGAAYALTKMGKSPEEKGLDIARSETRDLTSDEALAPRKAIAAIPARDTFGSSTAQEITQSRPIDDFGSSMASTDKGSIDAFRKSELDRKARIEALRGSQTSDRKMALSAFDEKVRNYNRSMAGAKTGKMIKASKGGSVVARGNKLARSKPTKLF
jgi:hypothetical protein